MSLKDANQCYGINNSDISRVDSVIINNLDGFFGKFQNIVEHNSHFKHIIVQTIFFPIYKIL